MALVSVHENQWFSSVWWSRCLDRRRFSAFVPRVPNDIYNFNSVSARPALPRLITRAQFPVVKFNRWLCSEHDSETGGKEDVTVVDVSMSRYDAIDIVDKLLKQETLMIFMKGSPSAPKCSHSRKLRDLLLNAGVDVIPFVNVLKYPAIREVIKEKSFHPYIPQLFLKGEFIGGASEVEEMLNSGAELVNKMKAAGVKFVE